MIKYDYKIIEELNKEKKIIYKFELTVGALPDHMHTVITHAGGVVFKIDDENHIELIIEDSFKYDNYHLFGIGRKIEFVFNSLDKAKSIERYIKSAFESYRNDYNKKQLVSKEFHFLDHINLDRLLENDISKNFSSFDNIIIVDRQHNEKYKVTGERIKSKVYMTTIHTHNNLINSGNLSQSIFPLSIDHDLSKPIVVDEATVIIG